MCELSLPRRKKLNWTIQFIFQVNWYSSRTLKTTGSWRWWRTEQTSADLKVKDAKITVQLICKNQWFINDQLRSSIGLGCQRCSDMLRCSCWKNEFLSLPQRLADWHWLQCTVALILTSQTFWRVTWRIVFTSYSFCLKTNQLVTMPQAWTWTTWRSKSTLHQEVEMEASPG